MNKRLFYLYSFFSGLLFFIPVLLPIYLNRSIEVQMIFIIEIVYHISIFLFEIPSGILGDRFGHDRIVYIGLIGSIITYVVYAYSSGLLAMCIIQFALGLFTSLVSGSDKVNFFNMLKTKYNEAELFSIQKLANIYFVSASLLSYFLSGFMMKWESTGKIILLSTAGGLLLSGIVFVYSNKKANYKQTLPVKQQSIIDISKIKPSKIISHWCLVSGVLLAILNNYYWIIQLYYEYLALSSQLIGILFMISSVITIVFSRLSLFSGTAYRGIILLLLFPLSYLLMPVQTMLFIPIIILLYSLLKIELQPFLENTILNLEEKNQSTNISIVSWISNSIQVIFLMLYSAVFSVFTFNYAVIFLGCLIFVIMIITLKFMRNLQKHIH